MFLIRYFSPHSPILPFTHSPPSTPHHITPDILSSSTSTSLPSLPSRSPISYYDFWEAKISPISLLLFYGMCVCSIFSLLIRRLVSSTDDTPSIAIFLRLFYLLPVFSHIYNLIQNSYPLLPRIPIKMVYLCDANIFLITALLGLSLMNSSVLTNCEDANCINTADHSLQPNILMGLYTSVFIGPVALKVHHPCIVFISFLICFFSSIISACLVNASYNTYRMIIVCSIMQFLVLYDYERSLKKLYEDSINLSATLIAKLEIENEKKLVQLKADEMRILIGNVAHDLKSPLQSFLCELDTLLDYSTAAIHSTTRLSSLSTSISSAAPHVSPPSFDDQMKASETVPPPSSSAGGGEGGGASDEGEQEESRKDLMSIHLDIIESVLLLKSICSFMAMLINRAVDFTKVSSGFKLQPQYGTANLNEVMRWVIQCTSKSSNNGVPVVLKPFPPDMCDHVITDTQWFSENVLCLVSNAQKFTTDGVIEISCRVVPKTNNSLAHGGSTSSNLSSFIKNSLRQVDALSHNLGPAATAAEEYVIRVEVEDEGIGIPIDKRDDLFQPFKQAQKRAGGTGLGLFSLSKRVESLGGSCGISDRGDQKRGCCFWFTVPYRPDEDAASLDIVPENPSHLFVSSEGSTGTDSRVNEMMSLLTAADRQKSSLQSATQQGNGNGTHGNGNKYRVEHDDKDYSHLDSLPDHDHDSNGNGNEQELSFTSHRKNLPLLPGYIRINASVKPFTHESIPLSLENVEKRHVSPKNPASRVPSLSFTNLSNVVISPKSTTSPPPSAETHDPHAAAVLSAAPMVATTDVEEFHGFHDSVEPFELTSVSSEPLIVVPPPTSAPPPAVLKILLVEDSPLIQKTIRRALMREGYEVDIAWNGSECLKMISGSSRYPVILMDLQMPVMDGLEASRRLRALEAGEGSAEERHLIIGISANGDDLAREEALSSGMDDFLPKPVSMSALKDSLNRHRHLLAVAQ
jgi:CheY-like chemotaxis protein/signal transduction histidine kinase